jgi:hypothetical protein
MLNTSDYIHCYENMLDIDLCKAMIESSKDYSFTKAPTKAEEEYELEAGFGPNFRKCYMHPLDNKYEKNLFDAVNKVLQNYVNDHRYFATGLTTEDTGYQHLIYYGTEAGEYKEHTDHGDLWPRVLTISFILNEDYDGGDFVFFNGQYKVPPKAGSAVVFPSNFCFPHAVTPVTNGDRHAVITWIH